MASVVFLFLTLNNCDVYVQSRLIKVLSFVVELRVELIAWRESTERAKLGVKSKKIKFCSNFYKNIVRAEILSQYASDFH